MQIFGTIFAQRDDFERRGRGWRCRADGRTEAATFDDLDQTRRSRHRYNTAHKTHKTSNTSKITQDTVHDV